MVMYPHVLNIIIAIGFPGSAYPMISSVITFRPTCWFVIAWIMPIGMMYTNAMMSASTNDHTGMPVGHTSMTMIPKTNIVTGEGGKIISFSVSFYFFKDDERGHVQKMMPYHHSGT